MRSTKQRWVLSLWIKDIKLKPYICFYYAIKTFIFYGGHVGFHFQMAQESVSTRAGSVMRRVQVLRPRPCFPLPLSCKNVLEDDRNSISKYTSTI